MKLSTLKILTLAGAVFFISCSNDKKQTELIKQTVNLKSDILIENSAFQKNEKNTVEEQTLSLSGKTILEATATLKIVNDKGEEVSCVTYPAKKLIHQEYSTANSTLKEAHIREVVENYFEDQNELAYLE